MFTFLRQCKTFTMLCLNLHFCQMRMAKPISWQALDIELAFIILPSGNCPLQFLCSFSLQACKPFRFFLIIYPKILKLLCHFIFRLSVVLYITSAINLTSVISSLSLWFPILFFLLYLFIKIIYSWNCLCIICHCVMPFKACHFIVIKIFCISLSSFII